MNAAPRPHRIPPPGVLWGRQGDLDWDPVLPEQVCAPRAAGDAGAQTTGLHSVPPYGGNQG